MCHVPFVRSFHTYRKTQQHPQLLSFPHSTQINLLFEFVCASCWCKLCLSLDALHNTTLEAVVFLPSCHCYVWDVIERRGDIKKLYVRVCRQSSRSLSSCCRIIIRREISPKKHFQSGEVWCCCITSSQLVVRTTSNFHTEIIMQKILPPPRKKTLYRNIKFPLSTNLASLVVGRFIHGGNFKMIQWGEVNTHQSTYSAVVHFRSILFYCCAAIPKQFSLWLH